MVDAVYIFSLNRLDMLVNEGTSGAASRIRQLADYQAALIPGDFLGYFSRLHGIITEVVRRSPFTEYSSPAVISCIMPRLQQPSSTTTSISADRIEHGGQVYHLWIPESAVRQRTAAIARSIGARFQSAHVRLIRVLRSGAYFGDLLFEHIMELPPEGRPASVTMGDVRVKSYVGKTSGELQWLQHLDPPLRPSEHAIIVDDIAESGKTLKGVLGGIQAQSPASVTTITLLDRPESRTGLRESLSPDYAGFIVSDPRVWAIGCGMDLDGHYRDLPSVYGLEVDGHQPPTFRIPNAEKGPVKPKD